MYKSNNKKVADRSRNESNAANSPKREKDSFMALLEKNAGVSNHMKGYTLDVLSNALHRITNYNELEGFEHESDNIQASELFERVIDCIDFNVYLHRNIAIHLKEKFTSNELACIFQAYNGYWVRYYGQMDSFVKENLLGYVEREGKFIYDLGNLTDFISKIESLGQFELEIFANLIIEMWDSKPDQIGSLLNFLKND